MSDKGVLLATNNKASQLNCKAFIKVVKDLAFMLSVQLAY